MKQIHSPNKQTAAFLVISLILLFVLSGLGIAAMANAISSNRTGRNYSQFIEAQIKAIGMAGYTKRILESYADRQYPGPATCTSSGTCNVIDSSFPQNGRPVLAWTSGLGSASMIGSSESNSWWTTNGFAYEGSFAAGNARTVVSRLAVNSSNPYQHTYRVVGYGTDNNTNLKATYDIYHVWRAYDTPIGSTGASCSSGCDYGECCNASNVCASDQTSCEGGSAAYVPAGWQCSDYFVTGLGYNATTCDNTIAELFDIYHLTQVDIPEIESYITSNGTVPTSGGFTMTVSSANATFDWQGASGLTADINNTNVTGLPAQQNKIYLLPFPVLDGESYRWECSVENSSTSDYLPFDCTSSESAHYSAG